MLIILLEAMMKGRRKDIGKKWLLRAQFEVEAKRTLSKRSVKSAQRFLDAALAFGRDFEPIGRLAGDSGGRDDRKPPLKRNMAAGAE
ncbi:hypothetical protein [Pseudomonas sp. NFX15]|uniref:hypothetical protein n=1 Tax=Pseudomonas sp. NFX15 TaxID=2816958 RepID=UPI003BA029B7